jgi:hypothetical protein
MAIAQITSTTTTASKIHIPMRTPFMAPRLPTIA